MTQEEILEYNKRCAEFLGWDYNKFMDRWNEDMHHEYSFVESVELKFHSDWNWIMEVVEAIEKKSEYVIMGRPLHDSFDIGKHLIKFYYSPNNIYLLHLELRQFLPEEPWKHTGYKHHIIKQFDFKNKGRKQAVVEAINQFLIWYNGR